MALLKSGIYSPSAGRIGCGGDHVIYSPVGVRCLGIETIDQDLALSDNLTAAANIFLGRGIFCKFGPFPSHHAVAHDASLP